MRIVHVGNFSPLEFFGGVESVTDGVCRGLASRGHRVSLVCFSRRGSSVVEVSGGFSVVVLGCFFSFFEMPVPSLSGVWRVFREVRGADLVHVHSLNPFGAFVASLACVLYRRPFVFTLHSHLGVGGAAAGRGLLYRLAAWFYSVFVLRLSLASASRVAVPSPGFLSRSPFTRGFSGKEVLLPHGVDLGVFNPGVDGGVVRSRFGLAGRRVVLFVSSLDRSRRGRGLELLLGVFSRIVGAVPDARLLVVGEGDMREFYERKAAGLGVGGRVVFAGGVSREELPAFYACCDVFVLPSLFEEPFGVVLLEAMACGKPVVAFSVGGIPYVMGRAGVLVAPGNADALQGALQGVLSDESLSRDLGRWCLDRARHNFSWDVVLEEYLALYQSVYIRAAIAWE